MERDSSGPVRQPEPLLPELLKLKALLNRPYVSLRQVSDLLGVSYVTCVGYVRDKQLGAVKVGGRYRVYEEPLKEFLIKKGYMKALEQVEAQTEHSQDTNDGT